MKISAAALPLLILAAALGALAFESSAHELGSAYPWPAWVASDVQQGGVHRPSDCCFSYTRRTIRCVFMEDYFETGGGCSLPAVIFTTKRGQKVCADPHNQRVQFCMKILDSAKQRRKRLVEKGY